MVRFTLRLVGRSTLRPQHARRGTRADRRHDRRDPGVHPSPDRAAVQDPVVPVQRRIRQAPAAAPGRATRSCCGTSRPGWTRAVATPTSSGSLLETPYHDTGEPMGEAQVLIESLQLMVAGNETSSNALTWIFYLLARHPEHIAEIRDEIAAVIGDDAIDFRNLHQLEGTMRVIDEALRLYPPVLDDRPHRAAGRRGRGCPHSGRARWSCRTSTARTAIPRIGRTPSRSIRRRFEPERCQGAPPVRVHPVRRWPEDLHRQQHGADADADDHRGVRAEVRFHADAGLARLRFSR